MHQRKLNTQQAFSGCAGRVIFAGLERRSNTTAVPEQELQTRSLSAGATQRLFLNTQELRKRPATTVAIKRLFLNIRIANAVIERRSNATVVLEHSRVAKAVINHRSNQTAVPEQAVIDHRSNNRCSLTRNSAKAIHNILINK